MRRKAKAAGNTVEKSVPTQPGRNGGTLLVGNPGNAGGPGRPPKAFLELCEEYCTDPELWKEARKKNPNHVLEMAGSFKHPKPAQKHDISARVEFVKARETRRK